MDPLRTRLPRRSEVGVVALALACLTIVALAAPPAWAVHDDDPSTSAIFELGDGSDPGTGTADILGSAAQPGPDWENIFDPTGAVDSLAGGIAATFLKDDTAQKGNTDRTTYASSASSNKNNDAVSGGSDPWNWNAGNVPAKDDLVNSYAWAGIDPTNGHVIVYVGIERLAPEGDSHIDIELFQDEVSLDEAPPCNDPGPDPTPCRWRGSRMDDDVLVSMDFLNGGAIGEVSVRLFDNATKTYTLVETLEGEGCDAADLICAYNNGAPIDGGTWPNLNRHGAVISSIDTNGFTEFGFDLTAAAGGQTPCISTILAKTRSSQSFTAELMDFSGPHDFDICGASIRIAPDATNLVGEPHTFEVTVNATVAGEAGPAPDGTVVNVTLTDSNGAVSVVQSETCSAGTVNGACNVTFTSYSAGTVVGYAFANVTVGGVTIAVETDGTGSNSGNATKVFVGRAILKLTQFGYDNTPTDAAPEAGIANGTTNFTVTLRNFGATSANLSVWMNVSVAGGTLAGGNVTYLGASVDPAVEPAAGASCVSACALAWTGIDLDPGEEVTLSAEVRYQDVPDGTILRATLDATDAPPGGTPRTASGSPALVQFTVQRD